MKISYRNDENKQGECGNCMWYENGICTNKDADYGEKVDPDDSCPLWEED